MFFTSVRARLASVIAVIFSSSPGTLSVYLKAMTFRLFTLAQRVSMSFCIE